MAVNSIFRSFTLPNGKEMRTMRDDVRAAALQAVKNRRGVETASHTKPSVKAGESNELSRRR